MTYLVNLCKVYIDFSQFHRVHSAAYIHAYNVWNCLIGYRHGRAYGASFSGMHVRHYSDSAPSCHPGIAHPSDLCDRLIFYYFGEANSSIHFASYL